MIGDELGIALLLTVTEDTETPVPEQAPVEN